MKPNFNETIGKTGEHHFNILNKTNLSLQKSTLTMDVPAKLAEFLDDVRNNFERFESCAQAKFPEAKYKDLSPTKRLEALELGFLVGLQLP